ncbi:unnamed protein product [Brassicogethes aeneus]|uniref:Cyclic nucleotide-binding domain-containing protein n=1 Tax=Brassicogethes aeneus TaxID=1431903 RepID=A0A9P0AZS1_BRAAE|nr:unnamed protein product [Brassicogethes aeneus]
MSHNCTLPEDKKEKSRYENNWRNLILISGVHPRTSEIFQTKMEIEAERQRHLNSKYKFMIHPFSKFKIYYDIYFLVVNVVSTLVCVDLMTKNPYEAQTRIFVTAYAIPHWLDVIMYFLTGRIKDNRLDVVLNPKKVCKMYLKSTFIIDFTFVFTILMVNWFANEVEGCDVTLKVLVFLQLFSMPLRINKFMLVMDFLKIQIKGFYSCIFGIVYYWWMIDMLADYKIMLTKFIIHFNYSDETFRNQSTTYRYETSGMEYFTRSLNRHIQCFYWSMTMVSEEIIIWFEQLICFLFIVIGSVAHLFMVIIILLYILSKFESRTKFDSLLNQVENYAEDKKLPKPIKDRLMQYYTHKFRNRYFNEANIMSMSSDGLVEDVHKHICRKVIRIPFFSPLTQKEISSILKYFEVELYMPKDIIYYNGSLVDYIYFISSGTVAAYTISGLEAYHLGDGDFFGFLDIIGSEFRRETTTISLEITEIFKIRYQHVFEHFNNFPGLLRSMEIESKKRKSIIQDLEKKFKESILKTKFNSIAEYPEQ